MNKMVIPISNSTKVCDIGTTTIYRANSPTIYACVMNLNFIAYIANHYHWWSFLYRYIPHAKQQQRCKSMRSKCTRTNLMHKPTSLKPSKTSPPLASIAEMGDKFQ